jgi:hypothetical protein
MIDRGHDLPITKQFEVLRRVLAWRLSVTMEAAFCIETLEECLAR